MRTHIVTDSSAHFAHPQIAAQYPLTVLPNYLVIAGKTYREGVDLTTERALELIAHQTKPPQVIAPSTEAFAEVYTRLAYHYDAIISIHPSRELSSSWQNAQAAASQLDGHTQISVIDTRTLDAAQGLVVRAAARAIEACDTLEKVVREVRNASDHVYAIYYVESTAYLMHNRIMAPSHALLNTLLETIPLVAVEGGELVLMEKARTRPQAIERLIEFTVEFESLADALILQPRTFMNEQTRQLQERLALEFPDRHFHHTVYSPSLAALIGTDATGLVIMEDFDVDANGTVGEPNVDED